MSADRHTAGRASPASSSAFARLVAAAFGFSAFHCTLLATLPVLLFRIHAASLPYVIGAYAFAGASFRLFGAPLVDRFGHRANFWAAGFLLCGSALLYLTLPPGLLLVLPRLLQGLGLAVFYTTAYAWASAFTPASTRGRALGILGAATAAPVVLLPPLSLVILDHWGMRSIALLCLGWAVSAGVLTPAGAAARQGPARGNLATAAAGLLPALACVLLINAALGVTEGYMPLIAAAKGVGGLAPIFAAFGAALILGRFGGGVVSDRIGRGRAQWLSQAVLVAAVSLTYLAGDQITLIVAALLFGLGIGASLTGLLTVISIRAAADQQAATLGLATFLADAGMGLGPLLAGVASAGGAAEIIGLQGMLVLAAGGMLLMASLGLSHAATFPGES